MTKEEQDKAFKERLAFIGDKNNVDAIAELKKNYSFHSLKFADNMDRWFDLWRKPICSK